MLKKRGKESRGVERVKGRVKRLLVMVEESRVKKVE